MLLALDEIAMGLSSKHVLSPATQVMIKTFEVHYSIEVLKPYNQASLLYHFTCEFQCYEYNYIQYN